MSDVDRFIAEGRPRWAMLDSLAHRQAALGPDDCRDLSRLYRSLCADLSRARGLDLPGDVQVWLDDLAARAHNRLYAGRGVGLAAAWTPWPSAILRFVLVDVPREVRASAAWFWLSAALFYGPFVMCAALAATSTDLALAVLPSEQLTSIEQMYADPAARSLSQDATMAGFYVYNNVGIAFRCFATGLLGGLG